MSIGLPGCPGCPAGVRDVNANTSRIRKIARYQPHRSPQYLTSRAHWRGCSSPDQLYLAGVRVNLAGRRSCTLARRCLPNTVDMRNWPPASERWLANCRELRRLARRSRARSVWTNKTGDCPNDYFCKYWYNHKKSWNTSTERPPPSFDRRNRFERLLALGPIQQRRARPSRGGPRTRD
jgi:hypothetical protein